MKLIFTANIVARQDNTINETSLSKKAGLDGVESYPLPGRVQEFISYWCVCVCVCVHAFRKCSCAVHNSWKNNVYSL